MKITGGTIVGLGVLGALGFAIYKFYKGEWKLPSLVGGGDLFSLPGIPSDIIPTYHETGVPGAIGDTIYNIFYGDDNLRERTDPGGEEYEKAQDEVTDLYPPGETPTPDVVKARAVAGAVAGDIHKQGLPWSMLFAPLTITSGLGAISQQERYYSLLPDEGTRKRAIGLSVARRQTWKQEHPWEFAGSSFLSMMFPPAWFVGQVAEQYDIYRSRGAKPGPRETKYVMKQGGGSNIFKPSDWGAPVPIVPAEPEVPPTGAAESTPATRAKDLADAIFREKYGGL